MATGDGLGVPIEGWRKGDLIVQAHRLDVPMTAAPGSYRVETGIYKLDDVQRFSIIADGKLAGDRLVLMTVNVKP